VAVQALILLPNSWKNWWA